MYYQREVDISYLSAANVQVQLMEEKGSLLNIIQKTGRLLVAFSPSYKWNYK